MTAAPPFIHHRELGSSDSPPLIMIHGLFGSLENLGVISRRLADQYHIYAIDLPNHGRSEHTEITSLPLLADAVVKWMDTLGITQAHFLGHSLGGKVSMEIALQHPKKVDQLVVADIAPVRYNHRHQEVFDGFHAVDLTQINNRNDADQCMQAYVSELSTRSFLLKNLDKGKDGWYWRINLEGLIQSYHQLLAENTQEAAPFMGKVLFIKGELSSYILPEHRDIILRLFPEARVKVLHQTQHWLHAEKPDIFAGIVRRFLAGELKT